MFLMRPCGIGLRRTFAHNRPSNGRSAAYFVCPVTLPYPSMRGNAFPTVRNATLASQICSFDRCRFDLLCQLVSTKFPYPKVVIPACFKRESRLVRNWTPEKHSG